MESIGNADQIQRRASATRDSINALLMDSANVRRQSTLLNEKCLDIIAGPKIQMSDEFYKQIEEMERLEAEKLNIQPTGSFNNPSQSHHSFKSDTVQGTEFLKKLEVLKNSRDAKKAQKPEATRQKSRASTLEHFVGRKVDPSRKTGTIPRIVISEEVRYSDESLKSDPQSRVTSFRNYSNVPSDKSRKSSISAGSQKAQGSISKSSQKIQNNEKTRKPQTPVKSARSISIAYSEKSRKSVSSAKSSDSKKILRNKSFKNESHETQESLANDSSFHPTPAPSARSSIVGGEDKRVAFNVLERQDSIGSFHEEARQKIRSRRQTPMSSPRDHPTVDTLALFSESSMALQALDCSNATWNSNYLDDSDDSF